MDGIKPKKSNTRGILVDEKLLGSGKEGVIMTMDAGSGEPLKMPIGKNISCLYHSWAVGPMHRPGEHRLLNADDSGIPMALKHPEPPFRGVQFHPESILRPQSISTLTGFLPNFAPAANLPGPAEHGNLTGLGVCRLDLSCTCAIITTVPRTAAAAQ